MSQSRPPIADQDKLHEVITAFLDGELTGADALEVEERWLKVVKFVGESIPSVEQMTVYLTTQSGSDVGRLSQVNFRDRSFNQAGCGVQRSLSFLHRGLATS